MLPGLATARSLVQCKLPILISRQRSHYSEHRQTQHYSTRAQYILHSTDDCSDLTLACFRMWTTSASTAPRRGCCPSSSSTARRSLTATWSSRPSPRSSRRRCRPSWARTRRTFSMPWLPWLRIISTGEYQHYHYNIDWSLQMQSLTVSNTIVSDSPDRQTKSLQLGSWNCKVRWY